MPRKMLVLFLLCFSFSGALALAADADTGEEWNPPSVGPVVTWAAPLCSKGELVVQPFFFYNHTRGTFDSDGHYSSLADGERQHQYQEQLMVQYGITDRLELDAQIAYQQNFAQSEDVKARDSGLGDSYLFMKYCGLEETKWRPMMVWLLQLKMPTGKYQHLDPDKLGTDLMGDGTWDPGVGVIMTKRFKPFIFHFDAVYSFPQGTEIDGVKTRYARYLNLDGGVEWFLPKGFNLVFEVNGYLQGDQRSDGYRNPGTATQYLAFSPGIGWSCDKVQVLLAYQRVALGKNTDANDSAILTCVYTF